MIPTKEQWFWEQCGVQPTKRKTWIKESADWLRYDYYPPIDLNNLFKYAVPKLKEVDLEFDMSFKEDTGGRMCEVILQNSWQYPDGHETIYYHKDYDPAQALFWAIYKALGGKE